MSAQYAYEINIQCAALNFEESALQFLEKSRASPVLFSRSISDYNRFVSQVWRGH